MASGLERYEGVPGLPEAVGSLRSAVEELDAVKGFVPVEGFPAGRHLRAEHVDPLHVSIYEDNGFTVSSNDIADGGPLETYDSAAQAEEVLLEEATNIEPTVYRDEEVAFSRHIRVSPADTVMDARYQFGPASSRVKHVAESAILGFVNSLTDDVRNA
jgi:hypothetical protein